MEEITIPLLASRESGLSASDLPLDGATFVQTLFNVINIFVGLGLLSTPYAFRGGGYIAGPTLLFISGLFCLSGHLIVAAFRYLPIDVARSYPELGKQALGTHGRKVVAVVAFLELFGGACMSLLVTWQQILTLLGGHSLLGLSPMHAAVTLSVLFLAPMLSVGGFRHLAAFSRLGLVSAGVISAVVVSLVPLDPSRAALPQPPPGHALARWTLPQAIGIFAVSLSGHSTLPALRMGMTSPSRFPSLLTVAFSVMAGLYGVVGTTGYWYYGAETSALITSDLSRAGVWVGTPIDRVLAALLLVNCSTKYPALVLVLQDLVVGMFPSKATRRAAPRPLVLTALRLFICAGSVVLSYAARDSIANVMSLVGGVASLSCSLLLPTLFFAILAWKDLGPCRRIGLCTLLVTGTCLMVFITVQNIAQMRASLEG